MKIETKFSPQQEVYMISHSFEKVSAHCDVCDDTHMVSIKGKMYTCPACTEKSIIGEGTTISRPIKVRIESLFVEAHWDGEVVTEYYTTGQSEYSENEFYETFEEAQRECDKENQDCEKRRT